MDNSNWWFALVNEDAPRAKQFKVIARYVTRETAEAAIETWASRPGEWKGKVYFYENTHPGQFCAGRVQSYSSVIRLLETVLQRLDTLPTTELRFVESTVSGAAAILSEAIDCLSEPGESEES